MSGILNKASAVAVAATLIATLVSAEGSGAAAQGPQPVVQQAPVQMISTPVVQPLPVQQDEAAIEDNPDFQNAAPATSLAALVDVQPQGELSRELSCLAGAIYFESKGESLEGQLAVGRVIVARAKSGRYPSTYCGVVYQPSQFSFIRGNAMPRINKSSESWRDAVAVARIADAGSWESPVEGAISFHATHVSPRWRLTRVARVGNHVFYR